MNNKYIKICDGYNGMSPLMNDGLGDVFLDSRYKEKQLEKYEKGLLSSVHKTTVIHEVEAVL